MTFQREADRLDLQHHVLCLTYNSKLYFSPIEKPRNALDVGTGTGIWAIDMGMSSSSPVQSDAYLLSTQPINTLSVKSQVSTSVLGNRRCEYYNTIINSDGN